MDNKASFSSINKDDFKGKNFQNKIRQKLSNIHETLPVQAGILNAAIALVFRRQNNLIELLFMQRSQNPKDPWSGHISFPGGACELEDQHTQATAIRETREELGISLTQDNWLGCLNTIYGPVIKQDKQVRLAPHIFFLSDQQEPILNEEAQAAFWVPLSHLMEQENVYKFDHPNLSEYRMYGLNINASIDVLLWGLSLKVLYDFFEHIGLVSEQPLTIFEEK